MSMSTHVVGIRPPDDTWKRMKAVWDACVAADVPVPDEVLDFFAGETPDPAGVVVPLRSFARAWNDDGTKEGLEIDVDKLPSNIRTIRFYNSW